MAIWIVLALFLTIPAGLIAWTVVSAVQFITANNRRLRDPLSISDRLWRTRRLLMIISAVTTGVMLLCVIAVVVLFFLSIAYM